MTEHIGAQALYLWLYGVAIALVVLARHTHAANRPHIPRRSVGLELLWSVFVFAHALTIPVRVQGAQVALQSPQKPL